jgi:hypothetical protein
MSESYSRFKRDPIPNIRAAGHMIAMGGESVDACVRADVY